ncbi:unnamed protein product [Bathycoccus prasinos]
MSHADQIDLTGNRDGEAEQMEVGVVGNDAIDLTLNDSSPPNGGVGVEGGGEHHQHQHHQHQHHQQHHQQHEPPRAGQPLRAAQTSIKNWLKPAIRTNDGRSNPSAGWETAPLFSSQHQHHQHHQQHHQQHVPLRAGQASIKNWLKPAIRTNDGRSNPSAGWETAPLFSSSLGGQKKMIMVEEPLTMKKKKRKTISQSTTMSDDDGETRRE